MKPAFRMTGSSRRRRGFSLTEMAIVMAIVGLVLGAIWVAGGYVMLNNRIRKASDQLILISHNMRAAYTEQGGVTGGTASNINQAIDQMKVYPTNMRRLTATAAGVVFNDWDETVSTGAAGSQLGTVQIFGDDCTGNEASSTPQPCFGISYLNIPRNACIRLTTAGGELNAGLQRVVINGTDAGDQSGTPPLPVSPANAVADCANNRNTVIWIYTLQDAK